MRSVGIELEMGDVYIVQLAKRVFELQGLDFSTWQDRWGYGDRAKKVQRYDIWNVTSDGTLYNSNGTRCMWQYIDGDGVTRDSSTAKNADRTYWQGAELVSQPYTDINLFGETLQVFINEAKGLGAIFEPEFRHTTHVHVDISDFSSSQVLHLLSQSYRDEKFIESFKGKDAKYPVRFIKNDIVSRLKETSSIESMFEAYRTQGTGKVLPVTQYQYRKVVNPAPWFKWKLSEGKESIPTCEFRIFPSTDDVEQIVKWVEWCTGWINSVATYETCEERSTGEEIWKGILNGSE